MNNDTPPIAPSPDEQEDWRRIWALERPSARAMLDAFDGARGADRVRQRIRSQAATRRHQLLSQPRWRVASAAAALVVGLGLIFGAVTHWRSGAVRVYATAAGQRLTAELPDGTQLMLGPASELRVPVDYARGNRAVRLTGEAFFTVVHDAGHPFSVRAGDAWLRDIGTAFDVRAYPGDASARVAVAEGRVAVEAVGAARATSERPISAATLGAGEAASVSGTQVAVVPNAPVALLTSWRQGGLAFQDTPLRDVVRDLARTFDLRITLADTALAAKRVTSTFTHESVDQILDVVTQIVGARYERVGRKIVIQRDSTVFGHPIPRRTSPLTVVHR